jgi:DNA repair exonuclease SbcCD ATPase subunit
MPTKNKTTVLTYQQLEQEIRVARIKAEEFRTEFKKANRMIAKLRKHVRVVDDANARHRALISSHARSIAQLHADIETRQLRIAELERSNFELAELFTAKDREVEELKKTAQPKQVDLKESYDELTSTYSGARYKSVREMNPGLFGTADDFDIHHPDFKESVPGRGFEGLHEDMVRDNQYASLHDVLNRAFEHAAAGKGHVRHSNGEKFEDQSTQRIMHLLQDETGAAHQAIKKIVESRKLNTEAAVLELLGAINYVASLIVYLEGQPQP